MGKHMSEEAAKALIERFAEKQRGEDYPCPRCGRPVMASDPVRNALSRRAAVYVCDECGMIEALEDMPGTFKLPLSVWSIAKEPARWGVQPHMITRESERIQVEGHYGTWHVIDDGWYALTPDIKGEPKTYRAHCFLLEHDEYGDEAASVIVDQDGRLLLEDVYNGFDDLLEAGWAVTDGE